MKSLANAPARKGKTWTHSKYKREYAGDYTTVIFNDGTKFRKFSLIAKKGKKHVVDGGSPRHAKAAGWTAK